MARGIAGRKGVGAGLVYGIRFGPIRFGLRRIRVPARSLALAELTADVSLPGIRRLIALLLGSQARPPALPAHLIVGIGHVRPLSFSLLSASVGLPCEPLCKHGSRVCPAPTRGTAILCGAADDSPFAALASASRG
jgi:hypothetical protein